MYKISLKRSALFIAVNVMLFTTAAYAENEDRSDDREDRRISTTLSEITVPAADSYTSKSGSSATGLDLNFKENPKTTTVITEQLIKDQQLKSIASVVDATSGVNTYRFDAGRTRFYARGFEVENINVDGVRPTYGTIYGEGAATSSTAIYDNVEIVKGANGLMDGSGNPSATINLTRKKADKTEFSGEVSATYDRFGTYGVTADVGSKLNSSGSIRGRAVVNYEAGDTYVDLEDKANKTVYGVVEIDLTDETTFSVGATHQEKIQDGTMWGGLPIFYTDGSKIDWKSNQSSATEWSENSGNTDEVFASLHHGFNKNWQLDITANYANTDGNLQGFYIDGFVHKPNGLVIGGIDPNTGEPTPALPSTLDYNSNTKEFNITTKLTGTFDAFEKQHKVMLGADYGKNETELSYRYGLNTLPVTGIVDNWNGSSYPKAETWGDSTNSNNETEESAVYGSVQLNITDPLSVVLGSRLSNFSQDDKQNGVSEATQKHSSVITPFIGATFALNDNASVFASYTDVFKSQSEKNTQGKYLDPIKGKNIEVGIKGTNDAETLQAQFSVFSIEQDNLAQVNIGKYIAGTEDVATNYPGDPAYYGAKGANSKGFEAELTGKLSDNWEGSLGITHFNTEDAKGNALDTINPNTTINVFTKYDMSNYISGLTIGGGVQWEGERYFLYENPLKGGAIEKLGQKAITTVNLMGNYQVNNNLNMQINVHNALNEDEHVYNYFGQAENREPLNVTGKISYKW